MSQKVPSWTLTHSIGWADQESIAQVQNINAVTPKFVNVHSLDVGPLSDLFDTTLDINGFGGVFSWPFSYVIIRFQVEGVWGYDKDQVALVVPDSTGFGSQVPTLDTPTINWMINVIKESEIDELLVSLNGSRKAQLLVCQWVGLSIWKGTAANQTGSNWLEWGSQTIKKEELDAFSSKIIHSQMKALLLENNMYVMTQSLKWGDGPHLPHVLSVVNMYTKVISGSKQVVVVVKNLTATSITKGVKVAQVVAVNAAPQVKVTPDTLEKTDEIQGIQQMDSWAEEEIAFSAAGFVWPR